MKNSLKCLDSIAACSLLPEDRSPIYHHAKMHSHRVSRVSSRPGNARTHGSSSVARTGIMRNFHVQFSSPQRDENQLLRKLCTRSSVHAFTLGLFQSVPSPDCLVVSRCRVGWWKRRRGRRIVLCFFSDY